MRVLRGAHAVLPAVRMRASCGVHGRLCACMRKCVCACECVYACGGCGIAWGPSLLGAEAQELICHHLRGDHAGWRAAFQQAVQR